MSRPWFFSLGVDWSSFNTINGKRFYNCAKGCLVVHPDKTLQFFNDTWFNDIIY